MKKISHTLNLHTLLRNYTLEPTRQTTHQDLNNHDYALTCPCGFIPQKRLLLNPTCCPRCELSIALHPNNTATTTTHCLTCGGPDATNTTTPCANCTLYVMLHTRSITRRWPPPLSNTTPHPPMYPDIARLPDPIQTKLLQISKDHQTPQPAQTDTPTPITQPLTTADIRILDPYTPTPQAIPTHLILHYLRHAWQHSQYLHMRQITIQHKTSPTTTRIPP